MRLRVRKGKELAQRRRKRGRRSRPTGGTATATTAQPRPTRGAVADPPSRSVSKAANPPSRSEQKNAAVRATLRPYGPGERPWSVRIAVLVAVLIGVGDLVDVLVGGKLGFGHTHPGKGGVILFSVLMLVCAGGMWRMKYWALLGFQAILAFVILFFSLALIRASNIAGVAIAVLVICGGGYLFYKLVRVLSRVQLPNRPGR
jgi:hypothetical protein